MRLLVSAGPTREFLDPVRFLSNRSTGRMGYAVAAAGVVAGHEVTLVSGPVALPPPDGLAAFVPIVSARDLLDALRERLPGADALVMTAAVADFRPADGSDPDSCQGVPNASMLLMSDRDGHILSQSYDDPGDPDIVSVQFDHQPGDPVHKFRVGPHRIGHVITKGETLDEAVDTLHKALDRISIEVGD